MYFGALIIFLLALPDHASAMTFPALEGKIQNHSALGFSDIKITAGWSCYDSLGTCGSGRREVEIDSDGSFRQRSFRFVPGWGPNRSISYSFFISDRSGISDSAKIATRDPQRLKERVKKLTLYQFSGFEITILQEDEFSDLRRNYMARPAYKLDFRLPGGHTAFQIYKSLYQPQTEV